MAIGNVSCVKCGLTGISKCPYCRSVFEHDYDRECIRLELAGNVDDKEWVKMHKLARQQKIGQFSRCEHEWVFQPDCQSTIGCGCPGGGDIISN